LGARAGIRYGAYREQISSPKKIILEDDRKARLSSPPTQLIEKA
jgi:hypothetical protein